MSSSQSAGAGTKEVKKENLWNSILGETSLKNKYQNKQVLVLGNRGSGKRTLIDSLHETSQTQYPKIRSNELQSGKLRIAGSVSALDYVYLNVKNLDDPDEDTMAKLNLYIIDDDNHKEILPLVLKQNTMKDTLITIMVDLSEPWTVMEQMDKWIELISVYMQTTNIQLDVLDQMRAKVEKQFRHYKEPTFDSEGKFVLSSESQITPEEEAELTKLKDSVPLPQGALSANFGMPIIVVGTKSDTNQNQTDQINQYTLYHLRKYCVTYGASLIYASSRNRENLDVYYEYMLHTLYGFVHKNKYEIYNTESIFIPSGSDNHELIKKSNPLIDDTKQFDDVVKKPANKNQRQEEVVCEDEQEFLKGLILDKQPEPYQAKKQIDQIIQSNSILPNQSTSRISSTTSIGSQGNPTSVANFYQKLLNQPDSKRLRENAEKDLQLRMGNYGSTNSTLFKNSDEIQQVKDIINKKQN